MSSPPHLFPFLLNSITDLDGRHSPALSLLNLVVSVGSISALWGRASDPDISQSKHCMFPPTEIGSGLVT